MSWIIEPCSFNKIFRFSVNVQNLALTDVESSEFKLNNVMWKIKICKTATGCVAVYLVCENRDSLPPFLRKLRFWVNSFLRISLLDTDKWSCETQSVFKLLHKSEQIDKSVVKSLQKQMFSHAKPCHGIEEFIEWGEFMEHFVVSNKATFEIEVLTKPMMFSTIDSTSDIDQSYIKCRVLIGNARKFAFAFTNKIVLRGIRWHILIRKKANHLAIYLCANKRDMPSNWFYKVNATLSLLSYEEDRPPLKRFIERNFRREVYALGYRKFIGWQNFIDKRNSYVSGNHATLEFEIKVDEPREVWKIGECSLSKSNSLMECRVCYECFRGGEIFSTRCGHLFCQSCFKKSIEKNPTCAACKADTSLAELHPVYF